MIFLYHVEEGAASRSYGLEVAALAGIPNEVLAIARAHLQHAEKSPIPTAHTVIEPSSVSSPILDALAEIDADSLTAREALDLIYRLKHQEQEQHG